MFKIGINWDRHSTLPNNDKIKLLVSAKVTNIEIHTTDVETYKDDYTEVLKSLHRNGLGITLHGRNLLTMMSECNLHETLRNEETHLSSLRKVLNETGHNYITTMVCHMNNYAHTVLQETLVPLYEKYKFILIGETLTQGGRPDSSDTKWAIIEDRNSYYCWDMGHTFSNHLKYGDKRFPNVMTLDKIIHTHIHTGDHHKYTGNLYDELEMLYLSGYKGVYSLECDFSSNVSFLDGLKSINTLNQQLETIRLKNKEVHLTRQ